ncbi:hypothetical protein LEP1GSC043_3359 [Leptospira weilii str. Ecochallenge]|uniref:Uncharacterized protein n=2 Tax=Leptospira weilii TaxID=28184 RepID=N1U9C8_9LEPT|nr:hypothetical protein LEP1GSC038_1176 [Leptospira weilii str. 2006001855]EMY12700.1 hypothetical protein LEP1GSC043_3359 [Leptospira weilii str. Ecochallenge]
MNAPANVFSGKNNFTRKLRFFKLDTTLFAIRVVITLTDSKGGF